MSEQSYLLILIPILILAFLVGCSPVIEPIEELPMGDIFKIEIEWIFHDTEQLKTLYGDAEGY